MQEIWKDIEGYEGLYQVSTLGNVKSLKNNKILKPSIIAYRKNKENGYYIVNLKNKHYYIHRLVAKTFINNQKNKSQVNHIDGNKLNNNVKNLEWVTPSENIKHAWNVGLITVLKKEKIIKGNRYNIKEIEQYDTNNTYIKKWKSIREASRKLNINEHSISKCCSGKLKTTGGYIFKYI